MMLGFYTGSTGFKHTNPFILLQKEVLMQPDLPASHLVGFCILIPSVGIWYYNSTQGLIVSNIQIHLGWAFRKSDLKFTLLQKEVLIQPDQSASHSGRVQTKILTFWLKYSPLLMRQWYDSIQGVLVSKHTSPF